MLTTKNIENIQEYQAHINEVFHERYDVENCIAKNNHKKAFKIVGYCLICTKASLFRADWTYSNGVVPNYREKLICEHCMLNNRQRFLMHYSEKTLHDTSKVYLYEQVTPFYSSFVQRNNKVDIIGSEYLGIDISSGETINNIRHEDALQLSFNNDSFDLILSNDVYEHVPDINKAIQEVYRVLKPKGKLLFSIPFFSMEKSTSRRALIKDGEIVHLKDPQYHGNPVDEKGSLVFYDFGWDLFDLFTEAGFESISMINYYDIFYGHIGDGNQFIFEAIK